MLCSRVKNLLSAYCDHELTGAEMLQIRRHLDACNSCREEHAALRQVKQLLGALPAAEARRPFHPAMLQPRPAWESLAARRLGARLEAILSAGLSPSRAIAAHLRQSARPLAMGGALGMVLLTAGALQQPRHPDAVSAHVPAAIVADDTALPVAPTFVAIQGFSEPLGLEPTSHRIQRVREPGYSFHFLSSGMEDGYGSYRSSFRQRAPLTGSFSGTVRLVGDRP
jgi:hypothetical protein